MFFEISNIGKVREARLEMRGITVLAGNNSTGKSTFGKALYCIFNAFSESGKTIMQTRKSDIEDMLTQYSRLPFAYQDEKNKLAGNILDGIDSPKKIHRIIQEAIELRIFIPRIAEDSGEMLLGKIRDYAKISDEQIQKEILNRYLAAEFEGQIPHVNYPQQQGKISLFFKNQKFILNASVDRKECVEYTDNVGIINRAFYVDSPFVVDIINPRGSRFYRAKYSHRYEISRCFHLPNPSNNISEEVIGKQKLKSVLDHINLVVPGDFDKTESRRLGFLEQGLGQPLEMTNVSAGMKTFLIIKRLLETGAIKERDVLILDEPEIHLHPEWQIKFAEALVLLQKAFDLTILLTTHSPYFLRAVEVFSTQQDIVDRCNYYYLENDEEGYCRVHDVTDDTDGIYQALAKPFQTLDNIYYASHDE